MGVPANPTDTFYSAADDAIHGYGAQLEVGDGGSPTEVFEAIAAIVSITPGAMETADIDTTHLRSQDAHREHRAGIRNSGPFTVKGIWLPNHRSQSNTGGGTGAFVSGGLVALWRGRENHNFRIKIAGTENSSPNSSEFWPFRGYVASFQPGEIGLDDKIDFTATFMPTEAYDSDLP